MNPQRTFCPNSDCPARGQQGKENITVHSQVEKRYICSVCRQTFSTTKGTLFYRLRTSPEIVMQVVTLQAYGCPTQAIVKAYGLDERTIQSRWQRAGVHCQALHEHVVEQSKLDLKQVQADEIKVKMQGQSVWMALAIMVSTRLWLGGVISGSRDKKLFEALVAKVRMIALCRPLLLAVDGLSSYVGAFQRAFRSPLPRHGQLGRRKLVAWADIVIVQVVKHRTAKRLDILRRVVQGSEKQEEHLLSKTQGGCKGGGVINTAYIERFNATVRQRLACLSRRTRFLAQQQATLEAGMYVVGCFYNFCDNHQSLRLRLWITERRVHWVQRTPAMAAALTDHCWSPSELFWFKASPPPWTPPKRRGRHSKLTLQLIDKWAS
jgi:transposase-like protein